MSADCTGPQVCPSSNCAHSTIGFPLPSFCCGKESVSAEASTRSPDEPVSTSTPLIVWHCVVLPGTQTVTEVNALSVCGEPAAAAGPDSTVIGCTFPPLPDVEPPLPPLCVLVLVDDPDPDPPHPATQAAPVLTSISNVAPATKLLAPALLIGFPRPALPPAPTVARRLSPQPPARARLPPPPIPAPPPSFAVFAAPASSACPPLPRNARSILPATVASPAAQVPAMPRRTRFPSAKQTPALPPDLARSIRARRTNPSSSCVTMPASGPDQPVPYPPSRPATPSRNTDSSSPASSPRCSLLF